MHSSKKILLLTLASVVLMTTVVRAASYRRLGTEFEAMRSVELTRDAKPQIIVVEFLHHGLLRLAQENNLATVNLAVVAKNGDVAPARLLQLGPGDFCRLAFEPLARQTSYEIYYGGEPPSPALLPKWSTDAGLLFESREYKNCNLRRLDSLRDAFNSSVPIGADYVQSVHHAHNPTDVGVRPFLSRYSGKLQIKEPGEHLFWTTSQDCSFLVIDGREVVAAPGRHGPQYKARPNQAGSIKLTAGLHDFEYYHAAAGNRAMMVVAWARAPHAKNDRPALLPSEWFSGESIAHVEPGPVTTRTHRLVPDFDYQTLGDVPLPDNSLPLIGVRFRNRSLPAMMVGSQKLRWDFGDGQTSTELNPSHVYLKPGLYRVSLKVKRSGKDLTTTNRIQVDRPYRDHRSKEKAHQLDDYLPILTKYNPATLDPSSARQLALAYEWKAQKEDGKKKTENRGQRTEEKGPKRTHRGQKKKGRRTAERPQAGFGTTVPNLDKKNQSTNSPSRLSWLARAVEVGLLHLKASNPSDKLGQPDKPDDGSTCELAVLTGSIARFDLGKPRDALEIYHAASQKISDPTLRAECAIRGADIAINELLDQKTARAMLTVAASDLGMKDVVDTFKLPPPQSNRLKAQFFRVLGDYAAASGKSEPSLEAYQAAAVANEGPDQKISHTKNTARRGSFSRSTEQYLKDRQFDRAAREIATWCETFPNEKIDGYFTLLYARLLFARGKFEQAAAQCEQLATVNRASPYLDRLLLIAAESQQRLGHPDRATALLRELIETHPGSPLVPEAKRRL